MLNSKLSAFGNFVREHRPGLEQMASRLCMGSSIDPEDVVGETLERALHAFEHLSEGNAVTVSAWLSTTLSQCFLEQCRQRRTDVKLPSPRLVRELATATLPRPQNKVQDELKDTIDTLRTQFREVYAQPVPGRRPGTLGGTGWVM